MSTGVYTTGRVYRCPDYPESETVTEPSGHEEKDVARVWIDMDFSPPSISVFDPEVQHQGRRYLIQRGKKPEYNMERAEEIVVDMMADSLVQRLRYGAR